MNNLRYIVLFLIALVLAGLRVAHAASKSDLPVISIESNVFSKEELAKIQKALGLNLHEPIHLRNADKGLKELYQSGNYQNLSVETETTPIGVKVWILGSKIRYIRRIRYINIDSEIIENTRKGQDLEEGKVADLGRFSSLRERMKQEYEARGFFFAEIQVMISDVPDSKEVDVEIEGKPGEPTRISKISFLGVPKNVSSELREIVPLKKGGIFKKAGVDAAAEEMNRYFQLNRYSTARIEESSFNFSEDKLSVEIVYTLKLGERYQFNFQGNKVFDEIELRELFTPEVLSQSDASLRIKELIENKYKAVGFHFVKVNVSNVPASADQVHFIRFEIEEGTRVIIDRVAFNGGEEVGNSRLEKYFYEGAPNIIARHRYSETAVQEAMVMMAKKLESEGYLKAQVLGPRSAFSEDKKGVELFFDVELGNRTYLSEIRIEGNQALSAEKIREILPFHIGDPVNLDTIEQGKQVLLSHYQNEGFNDVTLVSDENVKTVTISRDQRQASVSLKIKEGRQFFVGEVSIEGNKRTLPKVILREMQLKRGDKFSPDRLRTSEENIALLGLFSRVEIVSTPNPAQPEKKDLKIIVVEIKPGLGEVGLGGAYEHPRFRLRTFLGAAYRNLLGLNQTASLRTEVAIPISHQKDVIPFLEYSAVLGYRAPYLLELPFTFSTQVGLDSFEVAQTAASLPEVQTRARIEERIERRLSKKITGIYRLHRYERTTTEVIGGTQPETTDTIGSTGPSAVFDFRNDVFNPTQGSYHTLDMEFAVPELLSSDNISFMMVINRNSFYFPLFEPMSLIMHFGGGYAHSFISSHLPVARLTNDLSLGGQSSLRGYSPKESQPTEKTPLATLFDTAYLNARLELITNLFDNVSGALFFDTGQLYPNWAPAGRKDGVGIGFRYKTPVGPIVIDIANGFQSRQKTIKFSFTIGTI